MLADIFPRAHARYRGLPLLGPHLEGLVAWLEARGYARLPIRLRVRAAKPLDARLRRHGVAELDELTAEALLAYAPASSQDDLYRSALVRSLVTYLAAEGVLAPSPTTRTGELTALYGRHLKHLRGLASQTVTHHCATGRELLDYLGGGDARRFTTRLQSLDRAAIEDFLTHLAPRLGRHSLQHTVAHLRSFLRFLADRGDVPAGLDRTIDTPRVYRGERLPGLHSRLSGAFRRCT